VDLSDRVIVVTGAASGIGRAMALRFAQAGARGVVVSDMDGEGARAVAAEIGEGALALISDAACERDLAKLIAHAEATFGPIDLFCANAGVGAGADLDTPEEIWDLAFAVNVRSHITAARLLVPKWVQRGEGYFLSTASAAGLLNLIGSAPYAVSKHAAVAFAEWLAFTYRDRGVRVSCLCPMAVQTKLLREGLQAPGEAGLGLRVCNYAADVLDPEQVAEAVAEGVEAEQFLILPHPQVPDLLRAKAADHPAWLAQMSALHTHVALRHRSAVPATMAP
jgi:NAD(P)-dependent dehydrogenase (short-subunit alcohol dehydrogenase family)